MKVIILEDDRIENVADGHARNYLLPRRLAVPATPQAIAAAEKRRDKKLAELQQKRDQFQAEADKLSSLEFTVSADAGEEGKLFGAVTAADIAKAVKQQAQFELDRKKIELEAPIKIIGEYSVKAKLFQDISATLKIKVAAK